MRISRTPAVVGESQRELCVQFRVWFLRKTEP